MSSLLKKLSISIKIHVVKQLWSLFGQFPNCQQNRLAVGSRRELVANCVHTTDADATKQFHRCVSGISAVYDDTVIGQGETGGCDVMFQVNVQERSDPSQVRVYGDAVDRQPLTFKPTQFTVDCAKAGPGLCCSCTINK